MSRRRVTRVALAAGLAITLVVPLACGNGGARDTETPRGAQAIDTGVITVAWTDHAGDPPGEVASLTQLSLRVTLEEPAEEVRVALRGARPITIPAACQPSTVVRKRSYIEQGLLVCRFTRPRTSLDVRAIAVGQDGAEVTGEVRALDGDAEPVTAPVPSRTIAGGEPELVPDVRLLSTPDFLNGDIADLRKGPNFWTPKRSENSINAAYRAALDVVLDDFADLDPLAVLVAGDLVDGRWGYDDHDTGNFGPVGTIAERKEAVRRAARTYYPQWLERFTSRDLFVASAIGDHEYGDNPWPATKRALAGTFKREYARAFTTNQDGSPRYADHPEGPARRTAYAGRPTPELQVVSLDVFDITPKRAAVGLDPQQFDWLEGVLAKAKRDGVEWIVVQGHVPIVWPVRSRGSSLLHYPGGTDSRLWKLLRRYDVDLYLSGEVHDTTAVERDGIVQISHGGIFQFGLTTALTLDFYGDAMYLTLRDYDLRATDRGPRLWETRRKGLPRQIRVVGSPYVIGTATLRDGRLGFASGILAPPED